MKMMKIEIQPMWYLQEVQGDEWIVSAAEPVPVDHRFNTKFWTTKKRPSRRQRKLAQRAEQDAILRQHALFLRNHQDRHVPRCCGECGKIVNRDFAAHYSKKHPGVTPTWKKFENPESSCAEESQNVNEFESQDEVDQTNLLDRAFIDADETQN